MYSLNQYLMSLEDTFGLTRTSGEWTLCQRADGEPWYALGNTAIVFRIRHNGRIRALRCYRRPMRHLREIYGERLLEQELFLFTGPDCGVWVDVVMDDWIEGETLRHVLFEAVRNRDTERIARLSLAFDRLGAELLSDDRAHGDLKPENILVDEADGLHPIDFDATYLPAFAGERSPELGTAAYQHPARTAEDFDATLDDYPTVLIATALHALRVAPELLDRYGARDGLLFDPPHIATDEALREVTPFSNGAAGRPNTGSHNCCMRRRSICHKRPHCSMRPARRWNGTSIRGRHRTKPKCRNFSSKAAAGAIASGRRRSFRRCTTADSTLRKDWPPFAWATRGTTSTRRGVL